MKVSWAPWRMEFIKGKKEKGCVFCNRLHRAKRQDRKDLILHRGKAAFVILNRYPYNSGHLMIVPNRHTSRLEELSKSESGELFELIQKASVVMQKALRPEGMNVGLNLGQAGGAGIRDHLHFHMVPRWLADTNFWPVLSATKGIPQHLDSTYLVLKKTWEAL